jgi:hypothetical protein
MRLPPYAPPVDRALKQSAPLPHLFSARLLIGRVAETVRFEA